MDYGQHGHRGQHVIRIANITVGACVTIHLRKTEGCIVLEVIWIRPTALEECVEVSRSITMITFLIRAASC